MFGRQQETEIHILTLRLLAPWQGRVFVASWDLRTSMAAEVPGSWKVEYEKFVYQEVTKASMMSLQS